MKPDVSWPGYENGGPYKLEHFRFTTGHLDLREFIWSHWHNHIKGIAEARVGTIDAGTVRIIYVIEPDAKGKWGIEVALDRPRNPQCTSFRADSLVRIPVEKPDEDYPSQTLGIWPPQEVPKKRLPDSAASSGKYWRIVLVASDKAVGDTI